MKFADWKHGRIYCIVIQLLDEGEVATVSAIRTRLEAIDDDVEKWDPGTHGSQTVRNSLNALCRLGWLRTVDGDGPLRWEEPPLQRVYTCDEPVRKQVVAILSHRVVPEGDRITAMLAEERA